MRRFAGSVVLLFSAGAVWAATVKIGIDEGRNNQLGGQQPAYKIVATLPNLGDFGESMDRQGNYLFMARNNVMRIVDISTPTAPTLVGSLGHQGAAGIDVKVKGNYAYYVFTDSTTFDVIDVTTKSAPVVVASITLPSGAGAIAISGNYAYVIFGVLSGSNTFRTIDITTPTSPTIVQQSTQVVLFNFPTSIVCVSTFCVVGHENTASNSIKILDISTPTNVTDVSGVQAARMTSEPRGYNLTSDNRYAIAGSWFETTGIMVVDLVDKTEPLLVGNRSNPNPTWSTAVWSHYAANGMTDNYIPGDNLRIWDIQQPTEPRAVSTESVRIFTAINDIEVVGNYMFLSCRSTNYGLVVLELNLN
jgi:hypothetical protein